MPATIRANIQQKLRQSDNMLQRSIGHLADVVTTVDPQHPEIAAGLVMYMLHLDHQRQILRDFFQTYWGTTEAGLWAVDDLQRALDQGKMIPDPKHGSRNRC